MNPATTHLLVAHGSRGSGGNQEVRDFVAQWRTRHPTRRIDLCFIEHDDTLLDEGLELALQTPPHHSPIQKVHAIPLILNAAGHVKQDLPEALAEARSRHPEITFTQTRPLGMGPEVLKILQRQLNHLQQHLHHPDPKTTGVILLGRGSSDAEANGELAKMARWLFEAHDHELVDLAFTGITWPRLETVVQRQIRLGMRQLCILPIYLFGGVLMERIHAQLARLQQQYPSISFALGTHFGFAEEIFGLLDQRLLESLDEPPPLPPAQSPEATPRSTA